MYIFLPVLSGLLLFLSFPLYISGYIAFIALVPLFCSLSGASHKKAFIHGLIFGFVYTLLLSYPLFHALVYNYGKGIPYSAVLILGASVAPQSLLYGLITISSVYLRSENAAIKILTIPSAWVLLDYVREIIPLFIPWAFAGYTQVYTPFIQVADITGIYGVTFIVIVTNVIIAWVITEKKYMHGVILLLSILVPLISYSYTRTHYISRILDSAAVSQHIRVSAIQGNFTSLERWNSDMADVRFTTFASMTQQALPQSDIIIWPETVLNSSDELNLKRAAYICSMLKENQYFITGITRKDVQGRIFNSALFAGRNRVIDIYDKIILFPYSESSYSGLSAGAFLNAPERFEPGKQQKVFKTAKCSPATTLCFESIYPYFVKRLKNLGSDCIINLSNDSWFGNTSEPYIHLYSNIARSIELRIPVIRSANSGISCIIDQRGKITALAEINTRKIVHGMIAPVRIFTIYSKLGDIILLLAAGLLISLMLSKLK